ncbi:MAG: N-acetylmuramoyl-L-alanine amidase [Solobacterium sp.]|nr:N-acetylmuramoyl-L-alanine amidase [Solobacterium sp.]MBR2727899.1 N-acetylmuramoyl-L-alanine amidase [Solobacterium sp.]
MDRRVKGKILFVLVQLLVLAALLVWSPWKKKERVYMCVNIEMEQAGDIPIVNDYLPWDHVRRPGEIRDIMYLTIHETDNWSGTADASAHDAWLHSSTDSPNSWHYTVDDHCVYHHLPDNEVAWNAGDGRTPGGGNMNGIGIEMCVNEGSDYEQTLRNTAVLCAQLLHNYGLTVEDIRFHADFMDKLCPRRLISDGRVEEFLQMVRDDLALVEQ